HGFKPHESNIAQRLACGLLADRQRLGPRYLKLKCIEMAPARLVPTLREQKCRVQCGCRLSSEHRLVHPHQHPFSYDLARLIALNDVLGLAHLELLEAVDRGLAEQAQRI